MAGPASVETERTKPKLFHQYRSKLKRQEMLWGYALLLPAVMLLIMVVFYPLIEALLMSFKSANLMNTSISTWVGLANFKQLIHDAEFWLALKNTLIYVFSSVAFSLFLGTAMALVLNENLPFRNVLRGLALIPWVVPGVVVALLFLYMFNQQAGIINWVLMKLGIIHQFVQWFGSTKNAMFAEVIANIWNQTPFYMLMVLAGLQTVPQDQYEAAKIDGASAISRFWYVTIPNIRGVLLIVTSLMVIWNFNNFDTIWATTKGGPIDATTTLSIFVYRTAFKGLNVGYAGAIGFAWLFVLLLFSVIYIRAVEGAKRN